MTTGEFAKAVEMRLDVTEQCLRQMDAQQIRQRLIGAVEIHAAGIGRQQAGLAGRDIFGLRCDRLVHDRPLRFRPTAILLRLPLWMMSIMLQWRMRIKPQIVREA
jgi:hypothetical protein